MNIFAVLSLSSAVISLVLGIKIHAKNPKKSQNRIFMLFCISVSILSFSEFGMRQSESFNTAKSWFILTGIFPLCAFTLFYFTLIFYDKKIHKRKKWLTPLIYLSAIVIVSLSFIHSTFYDNPIYSNGYFEYSLPNRFGDPLSSFNFTFVIILTFLSICLYIRIIFSNNFDNLKKKQAGLILIGILIPFLAFIIINLAFPIIIPNFTVLDLTTLGLIITCIIIGYAMWRYELFSIDFSTASEKIFASISDYLILTDPDDKILLTNQQLLNLIGYKEDELLEKSLEVLISPDHVGKLSTYRSKFLTVDEKRAIPMDIEIDLKTKTN